MRLAKIEDGKIVNIIEADDVIDGYVAMPGSAEECGIGDNFINGEFARDSLPLPWSRDTLLNKVREARVYALNALIGIITTERENAVPDQTLIDACLAARLALLDITKGPAVDAATDDVSLTITIVQAYTAIVAAAPAAIKNAFADMHL